MSRRTCFTEDFLTAVGGYDGGCGPVVCEVRDMPQPGDSPLIPDAHEVYPLDVEDPNRHWTPLCQRCKDAMTAPYQERPSASPERTETTA
jgi:hypothetical protein